MKQKITRFLVWLAATASEIYLIYLWLFNGIQWAENLIKFWLVLGFISVFFGAFITEARLKVRKKGRSVPKELAYVGYILSIALLASQGNYLFATIATLAAVFEMIIFEGSN